MSHPDRDVHKVVRSKELKTQNGIKLDKRKKWVKSLTCLNEFSEKCT